MIKIIFLFFISFSAWSKVNLELVLPPAPIKQGEIVAGRLVLKEAQGQASLNGLKGKNLNKTLYLLNLSPFMNKKGSLESEVKVIFFAVPNSNTVSETLNGEEVSIYWNDIQIIPTEASKSFLFGDFEIPGRRQILKWILGLIILLVVIVSGLWLNKKLKNKTALKQHRSKLKKELLGCTSYIDVVLMWQNKRSYLQQFPEIEDQFKGLEKILFKHQFKAIQTENEMREVFDAYQDFKQQAGGVLNGI